MATAGTAISRTLGDYSSGLNHILPTAGAARFSGGLSVRDFLRLSTTLEVSGKGLGRIGPVARRLAEAEHLDAHARLLELRLDAADRKSTRPINRADRCLQ